MKTAALLNQKGGVGKTTATVNAGVGLARMGLRVVLADLDPQAHLTRSLGVTPARGSLHDALRGALPMADILVPAEGLLVAPADMALSGADLDFASAPGKERLLARALQGLPCDVCLIDCPPNLGLLTVNALAAAGSVLIPVQAEYLALAGLAALMDTVEAARTINPGLEVLGIALMRYSHRKRLCREVASAVRSHFPDLLLETRVRECVSLAEAPGFGRSVFAYAPGRAGARDFAALARELAARGLA